MARIKKKSARYASPRARSQSAKRIGAAINRAHLDHAERYLDQLLDDALEQTFPASDAIAVVLTRSNS